MLCSTGPTTAELGKDTTEAVFSTTSSTRRGRFGNLYQRAGLKKKWDNYSIRCDRFGQNIYEAHDTHHCMWF